jgi:hypothetical protein
VVVMKSLILSFFLALCLTLTGGCGYNAPVSSAVAASEANDVHLSALGKQIYVDVSRQYIDVYENGQLIRSFPVSTGKPATPTDIGRFRIYEKRLWDCFPTIENCKTYKYYSMFFNGGEAFHYAWWHNNFGRQPMSLGCVNMRESDVAWLFNWAPLGTEVVVHRGGERPPVRPVPGLPRGTCEVRAPWGETVVFASPNWSDKTGYTLPNGTRVTVDATYNGFVGVSDYRRVLPDLGLSQIWLNRDVLVCSTDL